MRLPIAEKIFAVQLKRSCMIKFWRMEACSSTAVWQRGCQCYSVQNISVVWCCFYRPGLLLGKRRSWWISSLQEMDFQNNFWYKTFVDSSQGNGSSLCKRCLSFAILTRAEVCCVQVLRRCEIRGLARRLPVCAVWLKLSGLHCPIPMPESWHQICQWFSGRKSNEHKIL